MNNSVHFLRKTALIEGASFLVLLFIAMPLKYAWGEPLAVRVVGMIHGVLFVIFCFSLMWVMKTAKWPLSRAALVFVAALIPFGPWLVDKKMRAFAREHQS